MNFILQSGDFTQVEKRTVKYAAALRDYIINQASLDDITSGRIDINLLHQSAPVGTVEFVSAYILAAGASVPQHYTYPACLRAFLLRNIWPSTYGEATADIFIKPMIGIKAFTGAIKKDVIEQDIPDSFEVWCSDAVSFTGEWRYYIHDGVIVGAGRYDDGEDDLPIPDLDTVLKAVLAISASDYVPKGYALDFGVLQDGRTSLIEANDGWALGYYKEGANSARKEECACSAENYSKLIHARWIDILQQTPNRKIKLG